MPYFIILRGPLGCGKTTIAEKLSHELNADVIYIDKVLADNNLDKVSPDIGCIPAENFIKAQDLVLPDVKEKLNSGKIVIFDACFYHKEAILHLTDNLPFPHHIFTLKAPVEVCIERDKNRKKTHGEGAAYAVHSLVSKFDYGTVIDISGSLDEAVEEIMKHLPD